MGRPLCCSLKKKALPLSPLVSLLLWFQICLTSSFSLQTTRTTSGVPDNRLSASRLVMSLLCLPQDLQLNILSLVSVAARLRHVSLACRALRVAVLRTIEGLTVAVGSVNALAMVALFPRLLSMTIRHYRMPGASTVFALPTSLRCLHIERLGQTLALSYPSRLEGLSFGLSIENEPTHLATCLRQCSSTLIGLELFIHEKVCYQQDAWTVALSGVYLFQLQSFALTSCHSDKVVVGHDRGAMTRVFSCSRGSLSVSSCGLGEMRSC